MFFKLDNFFFGTFIGLFFPIILIFISISLKSELNFSFDDSTEIKYGLPVRSFNSFEHAADEAAISRLYGGIHYRMAVEHGVVQGDKVGRYISQNLISKIEDIDIVQN